MSRPRGEPTVTCAFRLKVPTYDRLKVEAELRDVSMSRMANRAIEIYLESLIPVDELLVSRRGDTG